MRATRRTPGPATASGAWGRREIYAAGSIAYPARHAVAPSAKAGRWADDAVAHARHFVPVVELKPIGSSVTVCRYFDARYGPVRPLDNPGIMFSIIRPRNTHPIYSLPRARNIPSDQSCRLRPRRPLSERTRAIHVAGYMRFTVLVGIYCQLAQFACRLVVINKKGLLVGGATAGYGRKEDCRDQRERHCRFIG